MKARAVSLIFSILVISFFARPCFAETGDLTIVFTGDMRGELQNCRCPEDDFGGLSRRSKYLSGVRKEVSDLLLVDVGDVLPLMTADSERGDISHKAFVSFKAMNMMRYDVMNVGESDLILGEDFLAKKQKGLVFPLISANIVDINTQEPFFKPYVIKTMKNGLRVGIIGLVNERYVINSGNLDIAPSKKIAARYIPELRSMSDIVIVLGHLGLPYSINLAESIEGIDVILSGHWDADSQEPVKVGDTLVMPTAYHSRKVGRLDLNVGKDKVYSYRWESTPLGEEYEGDKAIEGLVSKVEKSEIGKAAVISVPEKIEAMTGAMPLQVMVFYSPGCRACTEIERDILPAIRQRYGDSIAVRQYDISLTENYEHMIMLEKLYGVEGGSAPEIIVSRYVLMGKEDIAGRLDATIQKALTEAQEVKKNGSLALQAVEYQKPTLDIILSRFESFSLYMVMAAGLLDGVNPCAFTTIVFFISFLALAGYRKKEMLFAGSSFILAVFATYLLIGLGVFRFLRAMGSFSYVTAGMNIAIGGAAFILGVLSLVDYARFKKTKDAKTILLKLPKSIKDRIHSVIGSDFRNQQGGVRKGILKVAWIAFTAGFIVSILESLCTGQVYLPTIAFVLKIPDKKIYALAYLILYNLAFIIPLVVVFFLGLFGATSAAFSRFMERRMGLVKLSTALLFFLLASALIILR